MIKILLLQFLWLTQCNQKTLNILQCYNIEKLKKTSISELLGYDPFSESFPEDLKVHLTPHYLYLLKKSPPARIGKILKLPDFQPKLSSISEIDFNAPEKTRQQFECPNCFKSLLLFNHEVQKHLELCA